MYMYPYWDRILDNIIIGKVCICWTRATYDYNKAGTVKHPGIIDVCDVLKIGDDTLSMQQLLKLYVEGDVPIQDALHISFASSLSIQSWVRIRFCQKSHWHVA